MTELVFAASPIWVIGPLIIAASAIAYLLFRLVASIRSRFGRPLGPPPRGAMAGLALVCGPLVGFLLSLIHLSLFDVNPLDVTDTMARYTSLGLIVGLFSRRRSGCPTCSSGPSDPAASRPGSKDGSSSDRGRAGRGGGLSAARGAL